MSSGGCPENHHIWDTHSWQLSSCSRLQWPLSVQAREHRLAEDCSQSMLLRLEVSTWAEGIDTKCWYAWMLLCTESVGKDGEALHRPREEADLIEWSWYQWVAAAKNISNGYVYLEVDEMLNWYTRARSSDDSRISENPLQALICQQPGNSNRITSRFPRYWKRCHDCLSFEKFCIWEAGRFQNW